MMWDEGYVLTPSPRRSRNPAAKFDRCFHSYSCARARGARAAASDANDRFLVPLRYEATLGGRVPPRPDPKGDFNSHNRNRYLPYFGRWQPLACELRGAAGNFLCVNFL